MEIGRACVKLAGREAGEKVVVVDSIDQNFVIVAGPNVKRRRCNLRHLKPLEVKLDIKQGASDGEVNKALSAAFPEEAKPVPKKIEKPALKVEMPAPKEKKPVKPRGEKLVVPQKEKPPKPKEEKKEKKAPKKKKKEGK